MNLKTNKQIRCELVGSDLYLYGPINPMNWEEVDEKITAKAVREALAVAKEPELTVHLNSPGGDAFEANAIANLLKASNLKIKIIVEGTACSGAASILCAGDHNIAYKNAMFLIHGASTFVFGNEKDLRTAAEELKIVDAAQRENFKARWKGTEEELAEQLEKGSLFNAEQALAWGFIDEILEDKQEESLATASAQNTIEVKGPDRTIFENLKRTWGGE